MRFGHEKCRRWVCLLTVAAFLATPLSAEDDRTKTLQQAFHDLYGFQFDASNEILDRFQEKHPRDPLSYGVRSAVYLFSELDRLGLLASEFFQDRGQKLEKSERLQPDPELKAKLYQTIHEAQRHAEWRLQEDPQDKDALFTLSMVAGLESDYMFFVQKKRMGSLPLKKQSHRYSRQLLKIDPHYYDAYLTTGFYEYLVGDLPFFLRWFVKFEDIKGRKQTGFERLRLVADSGQYCGSFAKILLAALYLREKQPAECRDVLAELAETYPDNALFRQELDKLNKRLGPAKGKAKKVATRSKAGKLKAASPDAAQGFNP